MSRNLQSGGFRFHHEEGMENQDLTFTFIHSRTIYHLRVLEEENGFEEIKIENRGREGVENER